MRALIFSTMIVLSISYLSYANENPLLIPWTHHNQEEFESGVITEKVFNGKYSAYIRSRDLPKVNTGWLWQAIKPPLEWLGERVKFTAYLRTIDVQESAGLFMKIYSYGGWVEKDFMENRSIAGNTEWGEYQIVLDIPHDTTLISFGTWISNLGEVHIDGAKFEIVDNTIPTTGYSVKREFGFPRNLNFDEQMATK